MNTIVLAGGKGDRLWPLSTIYPKALVPLVGKPVIYYLLDNISRIKNVSSITISIDGNQEENFKEQQDLIFGPFVKDKPSMFVHPLVNGSAIGPLSKLKDIVESGDRRFKASDDFLVVGADNLFGIELDEFYQSYHKQERQDRVAVNVLYTYADLSEVGVPICDLSGDIEDVQEKQKGLFGTRIATACYCFKRETLMMVGECLNEEKYDALGYFLKWLARNGVRTRSYDFREPWFDVGTREGLIEANSYLLAESFVREHALIDGEVSFDGPIHLDETVSLRGPSRVGPFVSISERSTIDTCEILNSIVYSNCVLKNCTLYNCIVGPNSTVEGSFSNTIIGPDSKLFSEV